VYLGGDYLSAFDKVDNFRKTLKHWKSILGWRVSVTKIPVNYALAEWQISNHETGWIDDLVSQGKATHIHNGRCPHTYHIKASDILPIIADDETLKSYVGTIGYGDIPLLSGMYNKVFRYDNNISSCTPDEILCVKLRDLQK